MRHLEIYIKTASQSSLPRFVVNSPLHRLLYQARLRFCSGPTIVDHGTDGPADRVVRGSVPVLKTLASRVGLKLFSIFCYFCSMFLFVDASDSTLKQLTLAGYQNSCTLLFLLYAI